MQSANATLDECDKSKPSIRQIDCPTSKIGELINFWASEHVSEKPRYEKNCFTTRHTSNSVQTRLVFRDCHFLRAAERQCSVSNECAHIMCICMTHDGKFSIHRRACACVLRVDPCRWMVTNLMNRVRNLTLLRTDDHYTRTTVLQVSMQPPYPVPAPLCVISTSEWLQFCNWHVRWSQVRQAVGTDRLRHRASKIWACEAKRGHRLNAGGS